MIGWLMGTLGDAIFWGSLGLLVGWNVMPQPTFVKAYYDKAVAYVKAKLAG